MNPSRPFILRPVATSLIMAALLIAGLLGYRFLPLAALPQVEYPTIQVVTLYPGASPGGWRIIGRTPWRLFDPGRAEPFRVRAGDAVRFVPVDRARFFELLAEEESR